MIFDVFGETVPRFEEAGRGGFMRRFLTLLCLLCLAIPAGLSITGCYHDTGQNYCNGEGYGTKVTDVDSITLSPQTAGISLAYGQTQQLSSPSAETCKGTTASVSSYTYGTTNNQLVDVSTSGNLCAGTWNRNTGGGVANYTICTAPSSTNGSTDGLPYATAYVTASADSVTSNSVAVHVHQKVTSISLALAGTPSCYSQGAVAQLDIQACYTSSSGTQYEFCAPSGTATSSYACSGGLASGVSSVPTCSTALGTPTFTAGTSSVATINSETNQITAELPGTTTITASIAGSGSSAGYFSTCPPKSISLKLSGEESGTVTKGVTEDLTAVITDTTGATITGLTLDYQSTDPLEISASSAGAITTNYAGEAAIYAICQPTDCNPSPIGEVGLYGTGLSISSNKVTVTTPGTSSYYMWFAAPGQSQYFIPVEYLTGTVGSTVRLPYVPNSMVMDRSGNSLYFGSSTELMIYSTSSNSQSGTSTSVPGKVLAVSPNNATVLVNDQTRGVFYLYSVSGSSATTYGGLGISAAWTPDSDTLYIVDSAAVNCTTSDPVISGHTDTLYVHNVNTGWSTYSLPASSGTCKSMPVGAQNLAITVPSVGAFMTVSGVSKTVDATWCPTGTVVNNVSTISSYYPQVDTVSAQTDVLAATTDGQHILGAAVTGTEVSLSDIGVKIPLGNSGYPEACPETSTTDANGVVTETLESLSLSPSLSASLAVTLNSTLANTVVNQVVASSVSNLAFITYTNNGTTTGATLPYYVPGQTSPSIGYVSLNGSSSVTAPLAGAFTPDDAYFFVSTAGDNKIHYISIPSTITSTSVPTDADQISPNLPACASTDVGCTNSDTNTDSYVPATAIAVKSRATT
jgi:sugar lactone lactonase YvrE